MLALNSLLTFHNKDALFFKLKSGKTFPVTITLTPPTPIKPTNTPISIFNEHQPHTLSQEQIHFKYFFFLRLKNGIQLEPSGIPVFMSAYL